MSKCEICGHGQILYRGKPQISHATCAVEKTERAKDSEFVRALRHQLDLRGENYTDFIAKVVSEFVDQDTSVR